MKPIAFIWETFKSLLAYAFIIYALLFIIVGGEFHVSIAWHHIGEFMASLNWQNNL